MKKILCPILLLTISALHAQENEKFLQTDAAKFLNAQKERSFGADLQQRGGSLTLPFFDDFSRYSLPSDDPGVPDEWQMWTDKDASINANMPISPLTIGVATLDGLNDCGLPYDWTGNDNYGPADTLSSMPIDLSGYTAEDNVFLLFYYEAGGLGNNPDPEDSLVVEFYSPFGAGEWIYQWSVPGSLDASSFQRVALSITAPEFLLDGFRIRFRNYATLSGNLDHWHLDYVTVDIGEPAETCEDFNEVAMQYPINTLLKNQYTAMPWTHFTPDPASHMLSTFNFYERNLGPTENIPTGWSVSYNGTVIENNPAADINTFGNNCQEIVRPLNTDGFFYEAPGNDTCATFDVKLFFNPTDAYSQNDSTMFTQHLENYYAYDDGTAERAYSLNVAGANLAVRYFSEEPDSLIGLMIHWTPFENDNSTETIFLRAWGDGGGEPGAELGENFTFQNPGYFCDNSDLFAYYEYDQAVYVDGTFYVGWIQQADTELNVGNDKNTDANPTHLFYQLGFGSEWQQSGISGSVMIRPVMRSGKPDYVNVKETTRPSFQVFPNPASQEVTIAFNTPGEKEILMRDLAGRIVLRQSGIQTLVQWDISALPPGIYVVEAISGEAHFVERLVKQ